MTSCEKVSGATGGGVLRSLVSRLILFVSYPLCKPFRMIMIVKMVNIVMWI